jgi:hypothetical protein
MVDFSYEEDAAGAIIVHDTRPAAEEEIRVLDPLESAVFRALDAAQPLAGLLRTLASYGEASPDPAAVGAVLDRFDNWGYVHVEGNKYLVLANRRVSADVSPSIHSADQSPSIGAA